ncbi:MAG: DNA internalization-related competence protein ComEC/Rec2 [Acidaminococcus sp.]|uniref:DNA internalization-related competence protein ComEC/Rec2 n=1 Tax=Acidaminococcus sp. TaxID=1872103 RepID=UPI0026E04388|nr:DNA internalization-related competence protein ComEC/Rec2 [Acidaminococcus sp.]MDO5597971.1 DNA internalization-related competence protein ComEC/Rec2 [Acidaminococcus sp.]
MSPVLEAGVAFAVGIAAGLGQPVPWWAWGLASGICGGMLFWLYRSQKGWNSWQIGCFLLIFCLGGMRASVATTAQERMAPLVERKILLTGRVVPGSVREGRTGSLSFLLEEKRGRVRVFVRKAGKFRPKQGTVEVQGIFQAPDGFYNPGTPAPETRAAIAGEGGSLEAEGRDCRVADRAPGWQDRAFALGETLRSQLRRALGPEDSALLEGMLLGGSRGIPAERLRLFTRCGLSHLLSVSGSHVALLLGLFAGGAAFLPLPRKMGALLVAFLLVSYGILCGLRASVCRALLLGLGALWGRVHRKRASSTAFLGLGLLLLPAWHPWWVWDPGFQLSFAAAGGLLLLRRPVEEKLAVWLPLPLARGLSVPLGAQILGLPFLVHHFHMLSLVSLLANVLLVPLLSLCLAFGAAGAMMSALGLSFPGRLLLVGAGQLLGISLWGGEWLSNLPGTHWVSGQVPLWVWPLYLLLVLALLEQGWFRPERPRLRRAGIMATGLALCLLLLAHHFRPRTFSAYFLDVGQGDCAVVVTPERQVFVFDTGGLSGHFDPGEKILVPFLRYLGTDQVDAVFLSHGHHDHAGGLAGLLRWMPVAAIYLPLENPSKDVEKALHLVQRKNTSKIVYKMQTNQKIGKKKSIIKIVEAPKLEEKGGTGNENSAIVRMSCDGHSFLFTGDAPAEVEELAAQRPIQSDVLKVSHHGSRTSSSEVFLETVRPRLAVISSGRRNSFGHPHRETIEKLETHRIPLVRTDQVGAVKIVFDGATPIWYSYRWQRDSF